MAEHYGFFEAIWDEHGLNPVTEAYTGWWDTAYLWKDFMNYFKLFVGNGVFASPVDQLKVVAGSGMTVIVRPGWAFINGHWYHNDENLELELTENTGSITRTDSIMVRFNESSRSINTLVLEGETEVHRGDTIYDLKIAEISAPPRAVALTNVNITDTRPNEEVCGFVKGLVEVVNTKDLFEQFQAIFDEWFDSIKDQLTGDLAVRLQLEFTELNTKVDKYYKDTTKDIADYKKELSDSFDTYKGELQKVTDEAKGLVQNYVDKDFVIPLDSYSFSGSDNTGYTCEVTNEKITEGTLVDVYWTKEDIQEAVRCVIYVDSEAGKIVFSAGRKPSKALHAVIRVRVK